MSKYKILTPTGYKPFKTIRKVHKDFWYKITFEDGTKLGTSDNHRIMLADGNLVEVEFLRKGDLTSTNKVINNIQFINEPIDLYDAVEVEGGHLYFTNNVVSKNCDASFLTSGDTYFDLDDIVFYEQTYQQDPVERRGRDGNYWIWEYPDYSKSYEVSADVARGDGSDYSAFHVWDTETCTQVAEYKGQLTPKDFGALLVGIATEYNNALLVVENASVGWATIEEIIARGYGNLYYGNNNTSVTETAESYLHKSETGKLTPGFTTSMRTRPLVLAKLYDYIHQREVIIHSKRLLMELRNFVWLNGKCQAAAGMNDDLVLSAGIGLFTRDTSIRLRQQGLDLSRASLSSFGNLNKREPVVMTTLQQYQNPYKMQNQFGQEEDISWVL